MRRITNLKIGGRLALGFSIMILLMVIVSFFGYRSTKNIQQNLDEIFTGRLPSIDYLIEADRDLQQLLVAERSMIFSETDSEVFKQLSREYETKLKQSEERLEKYKALAPHVKRRRSYLSTKRQGKNGRPSPESWWRDAKRTQERGDAWRLTLAWGLPRRGLRRCEAISTNCRRST